jgi:NADPH:quinone reductase-like Zn-dependent oxidoreductase
MSLQTRPTPVAGPGDVVVAVRAAGVNAADLLQRRGLYAAPTGWPPDVPGLEIAGVVDHVGDGVDPALRGRRVCAVVGGGGHATHCLVPAEHLIPVPDRVPWVEAGGFSEAFLTAHDALASQAHLGAGEHVLVSGAAGGVGVAAVQIARLLGATVTAVTRTPEHHARLREVGATLTVNPDEEPSLAPVDVVIELVGAAHLEGVQTILAPRARVVVIGVGGGARAEIDLLRIMALRATLTGSTLRARSRREKAEVTERASVALVAAWADGRLRVPVERTFDLADAVAAYEYFARPGKFGKIVLLVDPAPWPVGGPVPAPGAAMGGCGGAGTPSRPDRAPRRRART